MGNFSAQAWLIVIGILLIAAVLLDGYRRMRKQNLIGQKRRQQEANQDDFLDKDFPNGGARVVERGADRPAPSFSHTDTQTSFFDEEDAPSFDDDFDMDEGVGAVKTKPREPQLESADSDPQSSNDELFMINVIAKNEQPFDVEQLFAVLKDNALDLGEMDIFHRYADEKSNKVIFSVANAFEPGHFNYEVVENFSTAGMIFFMRLPNPAIEHALDSYDDMLDCARNVAYSLGAELKDADHNLLTNQSSMHDRQRIEDYIRRSYRMSAH